MALTRRPAKEPVSSSTYAAIKRQILDLTFAPGELLSELRLSQMFGSSRTPVREALKRLENDGLVDIIPQQGTFVSPIRRELVMDAQFARAALECALVRQTAERRSDEQMHTLQYNLDCQDRAAAAGKFDELYRLDEDMHQQIATAAGRPALWNLISDIKIHMDRARKLTLQPDHVPTICRQHREIIEAIEAKAADDAAAAMDRHLRFVIEHFDEFVTREQALEVGRQI